MTNLRIKELEELAEQKPKVMNKWLLDLFCELRGDIAECKDCPVAVADFFGKDDYMCADCKTTKELVDKMGWHTVDENEKPKGKTLSEVLDIEPNTPFRFKGIGGLYKINEDKFRGEQTFLYQDYDGAWCQDRTTFLLEQILLGLAEVDPACKKKYVRVEKSEIIEGNLNDIAENVFEKVCKHYCVTEAGCHSCPFWDVSSNPELDKSDPCLSFVKKHPTVALEMLGYEVHER